MKAELVERARMEGCCVNAGEEWVLNVGARMGQRCLSASKNGVGRGCFKRVGSNRVLLQDEGFCHDLSNISIIMATQSSPDKRRGLHTAGPVFTSRTNLPGKWRAGVVR